MTQPTQTIDISPERVAPIAQAGIQLLNLSSTLVPGNLRAQIGVLEVYLGGLAGGQLVLAPTPPPPVESGTRQAIMKDAEAALGLDDGRAQEETNDSGSAPGGDGSPEA